MNNHQNKPLVIAFSLIAVLAIVAVVIFMRQSKSQSTGNSSNSAHPNKKATTLSDDAPDLAETTNDVDKDDTRTYGTPEELIGTIQEIILKAGKENDPQAIIDFIGQKNLTDAQIKQLHHLAVTSQLKLTKTIKDDRGHWQIRLSGQQQLNLNLTQSKNGRWSVKTLSLSKEDNKHPDGADSSKKTQNADSKAEQKGAESTTAPSSIAITNSMDELTKMIYSFTQKIISLDPTEASVYTDSNKVSYATLAGLCIIFEEGHYQLVHKSPIRKMFQSHNAAGWIIRIESPESKKSAMIGISTKRSSPQSPWKITEINLDKLLSDYAKRFSGGDIHYVPLIKNPHGGDSVVIYFKLDSDELTQRTKRQLTIIATLLKSAQKKKLTISGYTDALGSDNYNLKLSKKRAQSVKSFLISQGVAKQQITISGFGEAHPRRPNTTTEGRRVNRRAEIMLDF